MTLRRSLTGLLVIPPLATPPSPPTCPTPPPPWALAGRSPPTIAPATFVPRIDNRYFPLVPGTAFHYRGYSGDTAQTDDMVVTHATKKILGVTCTVVRDTVAENGKPVERT